MASKVGVIWAVRAAIVVVALGSLVATISFQSNPDPPGAPATPSVPAGGSTPPGADIVVPDLLGSATAVARRILIAEGLVASVGYLKDGRPGLWSVVQGQDPRPGERLPIGETVSLFVSKQERPPLDLPELRSGAACPVTPVHPSPRFRQAITTAHVKLGSASEDGVIHLDDYPQNEDGAAVSLLWGTVGGYKGPLLVRGDRIDGDGEPTFFQDPDPIDSRLLPRGTSSEFHFESGGAPDGFAWTTVVHLPASGCYAFQIDGRNFTEHLIVAAL